MSDQDAVRVCMITARTDDYQIGVLCDRVNNDYAARRGYEFICDVFSREQLTGRHPTYADLARTCDIMGNNRTSARDIPLSQVAQSAPDTAGAG